MAKKRYPRAFAVVCLHSFCTGRGLEIKLPKIGQGVIVLDTLHLRETGSLVLQGEYSEVQKQLRHGELAPGFKTDLRYQAVGDLRGYGLPIRLSINKKFGEPNSKIEIFEAGKKTKTEWLDCIARFRVGDPLDLEVLRADLCADTSAVSVGWCLNHITVPYRRFHSAGGDMVWSEWRMGSQDVQTIYYGKRPNMVRVYDKRAELQAGFSKLRRAVKNSSSAIREQVGEVSFEQFAASKGYADLPPRFTRIERQCHGARVPAVLGTLGRVVKNLADFNPFDGYRITAGGADFSSLTPDAQMTARGFVSLVEEKGLHFVRAQLSRDRHYNRDWQWCEQYLPGQGCDGITAQALFEICRESTLKQLRG